MLAFGILGFQLDRRDELRHLIHVVLVEGNPLYPRRVALHDQRPVLQIGKYVFRDAVVVPEKVGLGVPVVGEVNAVKACEAEYTVAHLHAPIAVEVSSLQDRSESR